MRIGIHAVRTSNMPADSPAKHPFKSTSGTLNQTNCWISIFDGIFQSRRMKEQRQSTRRPRGCQDVIAVDEWALLLAERRLSSMLAAPMNCGPCEARLSITQPLLDWVTRLTPSPSPLRLPLYHDIRCELLDRASFPFNRRRLHSFSSPTAFRSLTTFTCIDLQRHDRYGSLLDMREDVGRHTTNQQPSACNCGCSTSAHSKSKY